MQQELIIMAQIVAQVINVQVDTMEMIYNINVLKHVHQDINQIQLQKNVN